MKTDEDAAMKMPKTIGTAKLSTALPPQIAIGTIARKAVADCRGFGERFIDRQVDQIAEGHRLVKAHVFTHSVVDDDPCR